MTGPLTGTIVGRYRVGPLLGRGGMGDVYHADDAELQRPVALKVLPDALVDDPDRLARFVKEARTASKLNHPHLVAIYEIGEDRSAGGRPVHYIAMELVRGETLRQILDARKADLRRTIDYAVQAAEAIAAAHGEGIVHRDLKPENVMVADGAYVKVLDFGLARLAPARDGLGGDATTLAAGTTPGVILGTVGYMSPEQAQGRPVDHRSDIFSFGSVLYESITGARPFRGTSAVDTLHRIINEQPPSLSAALPSAPPELQRIVRKCLAKDPDDRYQTMKDVVVDLRDVRRELESGSGPAVAPPARRAPRRAALVAAVALVAAAALIGGWLAWRGGDGATGAALSIERLTTSGIVIDAVISSDGKWLAYVESFDGRQSLWVRQTGGTTPLQLVSPLPGGFWGIAFSKDATAVYYALKSGAQPLGTLYSIPILGGTPRALLSGIDSAVTFSPDGTRLAYYRVEPGQQGANSLVVAGADGSDPQPLVTRQPPEFFVPGFFSSPSWSPDGRRIAGAVRDSSRREARLVAIDVQDRSEHAFPERYADATFTSWLPDGSGIVFAARAFGEMGTGNGGQLRLQPYPSGEVRRITTDVLEYRNASITEDGRSLVTVAFEATGRIALMPIAGGDARWIATDRYDGAAGMAWAPDGQRIFYTHVVRNNLEIWSRSVDGSDAKPVIARVRPGGIGVTPDGRSLVYAAEDGEVVKVWRADIDGTNARPLGTVRDAFWITVSPDGRWVFFMSSARGANATFKMPIDGGEPVLVAEGLERAVLSRDGTLAAGVYRKHPRAGLSLGVLDVETGTPVTTFSDFQAASGGGGIAFTPDGKELIYTTAERVNLWRRSLAGGDPVKITNFADFGILRFVLSPDGTSVLLCRGSAVRDAMLLTNFR